MKHIHLETVDSTMNYLARPEFEACEDSFILVTTEVQTCGRGQQGNRWESEAGKNLLFSLRIHRPPLLAKDQFHFAEINALALVETLDQYAEGFCIKWPNDIYHKDQKICGTLTTHTLQGQHLKSSLIGVGININQTTFYSDAPNPVSLIHIVGHEVDRQTILTDYLQRLKNDLARVSMGNQPHIHQRYLQRLYRLQEWHTYRTNGQTFMGKIIDVTHTGCLVVEMQSGEVRTFVFKEIEYA